MSGYFRSHILKSGFPKKMILMGLIFTSKVKIKMSIRFYQFIEKILILKMSRD
ncbi:hypothetical protein LT85_2312 [Collimonas arenae]|uniref:Uncharacterized protein n=1 Tax=Collimonas arenae TaxID=279058 RepID=A0A0A1FCG7_9BURK|nr:hypothetical protein LT85_2312 [Collimonas arenae]